MYNHGADPIVTLLIRQGISIHAGHPGGTFPPDATAPNIAGVHDFLVLNQCPDLTPELPARLPHPAPVGSGGSPTPP